MDPETYAEVASYPPGNITARRTRAAWDALALRPRVLPGRASPDLGVTVLGQRLGVPFMLAPAGFHTRAHPDGELASARAAADAGRLLVSNHGVRLDNTQAPVEVLPEVVTAVGGRAEVYLDGGIRRGADVVKALALGARAAFIGRPIFWGLAHGGAPGLSSLLAVLREEIEFTMMLTGRPTVASLAPSLLSPMPDLPPHR